MSGSGRKRVALTFREIVESDPSEAGELVADAIEAGHPRGAPPSARVIGRAHRALEALECRDVGVVIAEQGGELPGICEALVAIGAAGMVELLDAAVANAGERPTHLSYEVHICRQRSYRRLIDYMLAREESWFDFTASLWGREHETSELGPEQASANAVLYQHAELLRRAIRRGAELSPGSLGPMLHEALVFESNAFAELLLELGAPIDTAGHHGERPLHVAAHVSAHVTKLLLARGADPHVRDDHGLTPLHRAADVAIVRALLDAGAEPRARCNFGAEPLHMVHDRDVVEALVSAGADLNARTDSGQSVLHSAAVDVDVDLHRQPRQGNEVTVRWLLGRGADPCAVTHDGTTALHRARPAAVVVLVEAGAAIDARDGRGRTPLMTIGAGAAVRALLRLGARVDAVDDRGRTALHHPRRDDGEDVVAALVAAGARLDARDQDGQTPLDCARNAAEGDRWSKAWLDALQSAERIAADERPRSGERRP